MVKKIAEILLFLILLAVLIYLGRPKLASYFYNRGCSYYDRGVYTQAIVFFEKASKIAPEIADIHYTLANTYIEEKMTDKAIEEYREAIRVDPGYVAAYLAISRIYSSREMYDEAIEQLEKINQKEPADPRIRDAINNVSFAYMAACFDKATELFISGDKERAYDLLYKALNLNPNLAFMHYTLGYFYFTDRNYALSKKSLDQALQVDPEFWMAYKLKGDIYAAEGEYEKAIDEYKKSAALNKNDAVLYNNLGLTYMEMERYPEALEYLQQAVKLSPDNINLRYSLASVYRDNRMFDQAVSEYQKLIGEKPDYPNVHNDLGDIYKFKGDNSLAISEYKKEIEYCREKLRDNPDDLVSLTDLAYAINGIGEEVDKAEEIVGRVLKIEPNYRHAYITLAKIYENKGQVQQSICALAKAKGLFRQTGFIDNDISRLKKEIRTFSGKEGFAKTHKIYLKNGRQISGKIKQQDKDSIVLEIGPQGNITLFRDSIEKIELLAGE